MSVGFSTNMGFGPGLGFSGASAPSDYAVGSTEPKVVADFMEEVYWKNGAAVAGFSSLLTFARSSTATFVDSNGTLQTASSGTARVGHHRYEGGQWVDKGLLLESEARTNLLLNSGTLSTQNVTTTADPYVLHFTGTGTVTLSGTSTAGPLVGTGTGEENRVELHFTPSAGTLTLTVSGTVSNAQLEQTAGQRSSYIPTAGATVTRAAETLTIAAANMAYDSSAMSLQMEGEMDYVDENSSSNVYWLYWNAGDFANRIDFIMTTAASATGRVQFVQEESNTTDVVSSSTDYTPGIAVPFSLASRNGATFLNGAKDGAAETADTTPTALPDLSTVDLQLGRDFMGTIALFRQWDVDLGDSGIEEATS